MRKENALTLLLLLSVSGLSCCSEPRYISSISCSGDCLVPKGEQWIIDQNVDANTITVHGTLSWDTTKSDLELRTFGLLVEEDGLFEIGSESSPLQNKATVYIKDPMAANIAEHPSLGQRYLGVYGRGKIGLYGRPLERTWSELDRNHQAGDTELYLKDDPTGMGWRVGDRIGVATTTRGESTQHTITEIQQSMVKIDTPLKSEHWGGFREIEGFRFWMAAEVVNLERSIVITGDSARFDNGGGFGWHAGAFFKEPVYTGNVGVFVAKYVRMEKCGQLDVLGRYCIHWHVNRECPECIAQGNAFVESYQSAVTLHGVHGTLVDNNVGWDNRGVGLYTEDGNEINNVISNNVFICHDIYYCRIEWQNVLGVGPAQKEGGIFMFGMNNDIIGNHVIGHEHGMWTQGAAQPDGRPMGYSMGLVCNQHIPFGKIQGNVFHDCQRFGTYVDFQFPRNVVQDNNGLVSKSRYGPMPSCDEFKDDGTDNGHTNMIEDQFDWHNTFVGGYFFGDISWVRYTSVNNGHAMYWKFSKTMVNSNVNHIQDSLMVNDPTDTVAGQLKLFLPGGSFTFKMKNVTLAGGPFLPDGGAINAPQHCGLPDHNNGVPGAKCNVQIILEDVDFSRVAPVNGKTVYTFFGSSGGNPLSPMYFSTDDSLGGYQTVVSNHLDGFGSVPGCSGPHETYSGYVCDNSVTIRRLTIWAPDMGDLILTGKGYKTTPNFKNNVKGSNAGILHYEIDQNYVRSSTVLQGGGYAANVVIGQEYILEGLRWTGEDIVVEVSDPVIAETFGNDPASEGIHLTIKMADGKSFTCFPNAGESRRFHGSSHIDQRALRGGSMGQCSEMLREAAGDELLPTIPTIAPSGDCGCPGAEYDESCALGGVGCMACGKSNCRYCGSGDLPECKYSTVVTQKPTGNPPPDPSTTVGPAPVDCHCDGAMYDAQCQDPATDPYGGLGCSACGKPSCRFCGSGGFPDCQDSGPTNQPQTTPGPHPQCECDGAMFDARCSDPSSDPHGGLGCNACGILECRFCGNVPYIDCAFKK